MPNPPDDLSLNIDTGLALRITDPRAPAQALLDQLRDIHTARDYPGLPLDTRLLIEALNAPSGTAVRADIAFASQFIARRKLPADRSQFSPENLITIIDQMEQVNRSPSYRGWYHDELKYLFKALHAGAAHNAKVSSPEVG